MKFNDGFWLTKKGYEMHYPKQAYWVREEGNELHILAPCRHVEGKGDTMNHAALAVTLSSPLPDVIRVKLTHYAGGKPNRGFDLSPAKPDYAPAVSRRKDGTVVFTAGALSAVVGADPWSLSFYEDGRLLTECGAKSTAYVTEQLPVGANREAPPKAWMREQLDLAPGEYVYGLGERFTNFVKNGQTVETWNEDGGTCTDQAYKCVPFYVTNRGYGVFVNHTENVSFEAGSEVVSRVGFSVPGEELEYFVVGGGSMRAVLQNYTALTGRAAMPPKWSFGLWLTTSFTTSYDEGTVTSFVEGMEKRGIPLSVFHFDCFWMKEFHLCDFEWDERVFPDPAGMLRRLKAKGLHICVWLNSYVSQDTGMFREGLENGYFVKRRDGSVWQWDLWEPGMALVDFTNPAARAWYASKLNRLLDEGVDCFKTDFGERIPAEDAVYFDGSDPAKMHNYYTYLYNKTVFETLEARKGKGEATLFARSATAGSQKFPVHWGGDSTATYASMAETLRGGLSLGLSGFGFWSHDISGFENTATPDLYKRWVAFGLLSSHSRLHGSSSYRVPWLFDEEAVDVARSFVRLKQSLMPYLYGQAAETVQSGLPMLRAMVLEFENDPACATLDMQYMLGGSLLVAPIFNDRGEADFYLPRGAWVNFFTGEVAEGGSFRRETHGYMTLPLYVRENSIVATGEDGRPDYDYADSPCLLVSHLTDGGEAKAEIPSEAGALSALAARSGDTVTLNVQGGRPWTALLAGVKAPRAVRGAKAEASARGLLLTPDAPDAQVQVEL